MMTEFDNLGDFLIMYHGTDSSNVESILDNGFRPSDNTKSMLGTGVYVSRELEKADCYGNVILTVLVHLGQVQQINTMSGPSNKTWQTTHDTAWVPNGVVPSGRQEHCIKDPRQIKVLGIRRGYYKLSLETRKKTRDLSHLEFGFQFGLTEKLALISLLDQLNTEEDGLILGDTSEACGIVCVIGCRQFPPIISIRGKDGPWLTRNLVRKLPDGSYVETQGKPAKFPACMDKFRKKMCQERKSISNTRRVDCDCEERRY